MNFFRLQFVFFFLAQIVCFAQPKYQINAQILSTKDNKCIIGAKVEFLGKVGQITTDDFGKFNIVVESGQYDVTLSHVGYQKDTFQVVIHSDTTFIFKLKENNIITDEIEIINSTGSPLKSEDLGVTSIDIQTVKKLPSFLGEPDIIKTVQFIPGVISAGEGSSAFFVRGGNADENLILVDNAPIYDPSHMLGLFSIFNSDIVKSAELFKNGMPASYGGRISSLLKINTHDGNMKAAHGSFTLGVMAAKMYFEAPIIKNKLSFILSGRRSYIDKFLKLVEDYVPAQVQQSSLAFYDINFKMKYVLNSKNDFKLSSYIGNDIVLIGENADVAWGNSFATLQWKHLFNDYNQVNTSLIISNFGFNLGFINGNQNFSWTNYVSEYGIKQDYKSNLLNKGFLNFGFASTYRSISPAVYKPLNKGSIINAVTIPTNYSVESAIYLSHQFNIKRLSFDYGLRYSFFSALGPYEDKIYVNPKELVLPQVAQENQYKSFEIIKNFSAPEPRISIGYRLTENTNFKFSYNRMAQYIHQIVTGITPLPVSFWMPSSTYIDPSIGDNFSLGVAQVLPFSTKFTVEGFYKRRSNVIDFVDNAVIFLNPNVTTQIRKGNSIAYGIEFALSQSLEKLKWNVSYTWSKAERKIEDVNQSKTYFAPFDRRHTISALITYQISKKWDLGLSWSFASGRPITLPSGTYSFKQYNVNFITERNGYRMPDYHRLDISANFKPIPKPNWKWHSEWNFSIYNVYNRYNAFAIYTKPTFNSDGENTSNVKNQAVMLYLFSIVPSVSYSIVF